MMPSSALWARRSCWTRLCSGASASRRRRTATKSPARLGPDEYHENINNSVFTNRLVQWHLEQALKLLGWLADNAPDTARRLVKSLDLSEMRLARWQDIVDKMYIPFDSERQLHIQFDSFFDLEYIPVLDYQPRVGGIWPFLGHERALRSQVIKQADVVMLMALLGEEVGSQDVMLNNFKTYYPRTDHGSSLSPAIHAWVAARLGAGRYRLRDV